MQATKLLQHGEQHVQMFRLPSHAGVKFAILVLTQGRIHSLRWSHQRITLVVDGQENDGQEDFFRNDPLTLYKLLSETCKSLRLVGHAKYHTFFADIEIPLEKCMVACAGKDDRVESDRTFHGRGHDSSLGILDIFP